MFVHGAYIYPVVPAIAATMLKEEGYEVAWMDGEAEEKNWPEYCKNICNFRPDYIAWEVKTPSVRRTWQRVNELKELVPTTKFILFGDHITFDPQESLINSATDIVLTGGDYDFGLKRILAERFTYGIFNQRTDSALINLPIPDRELTKWRLYGYEKGSGNYKYLPGTHTYFGRDCWWRREGGCTFCSWTNTYKNFRVVSVDRAIDEIIACHRLGIKEIFDDTGTFPIGGWLHEFCEKIIKLREKGILGRKFPVLGCNMRPGALNKEQYDLLGRAGFRFILYGLESANQETLVRINKGQKPGDMLSTLTMAKKSGLEPHVTCMVSYPWETYEDARRTISFTKDLFKKGLIDTLQATICIPYPGTALYKQCLENGWLKYHPRDWDMWDMRRPVMETGIPDEDLLELTQGIYKSCINPNFIVRKVLSIRSVDDIQHYWRAAKFMIGHLTDFNRRQHERDSA